MNVEIWSDIACPFCYIGKRKFEEALNDFENRDNVNVTFKSFQLDPGAPKETDQSMNEMLADKYGMSTEKAQEMNGQVAAQAKEVGLDYELDTLVLTNTEDAHRLSHLAKELGKMNELKERLLRAYFIESRHVGDFNTLVELAADVGIDEEKARACLQSDAYKADVEADMKEGKQLGVQGVPFFVFNRKYGVSGAQPPEAFLEVLNKVQGEENSEQ